MVMTTIPHHISWLNRASRFGPPWGCQIFQSPVCRLPMSECGWWASRASSASKGWVLAKPVTAAHRPKLDSYKFGDETEDQTGDFIGSCTRFKVFHYTVHTLIPSVSWSIHIIVCFCHSRDDIFLPSLQFSLFDSNVIPKERRGKLFVFDWDTQVDIDQFYSTGVLSLALLLKAIFMR